MVECVNCAKFKGCDLSSPSVNECADYTEKLTNEEWFCGLPTEEKAKWLSQRSEILYDCGQRDVFPKVMYEEDWEWWLKEKHE